MDTLYSITDCSGMSSGPAGRIGISPPGGFPGGVQADIGGFDAPHPLDFDLKL